MLARSSVWRKSPKARSWDGRFRARLPTFIGSDLGFRSAPKAALRSTDPKQTSSALNREDRQNERGRCGLIALSGEGRRRLTMPENVSVSGGEAAMSASPVGKPVVHFVGSITLPDAETVFRTISQAAGPHLRRLPDGETGVRKTWIRFLQQVLADNPAIEVARDVPPFKFTQWDGRVLREIPRLRVKQGARLDPATFKTGYTDMAIESWRLFDRLQQEGVIPAGVKFQVSLPTPIAPTYNNMVPADRPALISALTTHLLGEVAAIARALPNDRIALQWDVCQEVIAWEGYYEPGPVDFRKETIAELIQIGDGVPAAIELGYHLCYGSPADEHVVQPKDTGIMVEIVSAVSSGVRRPIQFFHLPVPKLRNDDAYFAPLAGLKLRPETELYLGLIHHDDMAGNAARVAGARRHVRVDGVATECGMARGDPERFPALLFAHAQTAELVR